MNYFQKLQSYLILLLTFIIACDQQSGKKQFPEYSSTKSGLRYHRLTIGEGNNYPKEGDLLILELRFKSINNTILPITLFKNEKSQDTVHFSEAKSAIQFYEAMSLLSEGDSCSFVITTKYFKDTSLFKGIASIIGEDSIIKMDAKLLTIRTRQQQQDDLLNYKRVCWELAQDENTELQHFLDTSLLFKNSLPDAYGMHFKLIRRGSNKLVKSGDNVTIRYTGSFLNGKIFDNSTITKEALNFNLGEPGQVVRGIELALHKMHEGDSVVIVLPSALAFGEKGSAAGIVSPFKTVTFALEILKIN
jgi:FKBP-type peptidyl-prolyl cis-trans isomerase FkpA